MAGMQNLHTHTLYCDGTRTPEEMLQAAIRKGCDSFGFSGHSYAEYDLKCCMSRNDIPRYIAEVGRLRDKYAGEIEVFTGIEQDYYSPDPPAGFDFVFGAIHFLKKGGDMVCVDNGANSQKQSVQKFFGGDFYAMVEMYYETLADVMLKTNADIVAHFDLITKYNPGGALFDESHPRYVAAAIGAMDEILKRHRLFEVNTGAMFRINKTEPYPSAFLLRELLRRGGEVILSSDSHHAESICYRFDDMIDLLRSCGFRYIKRLSRTGFVDVPL